MNIRKNVDGLKFSTWLLLAGALVLFIYSSVMWRKFVFLSDDRVVWGAIEKALSTPGVEVTTDDSAESVTQKESSKLDFYKDLSAETITEYKNDEIDTIIKTVSTKEKDYLYYERNGNVTYPQLKDLEGQWVDITLPGQTESKSLADTFTNGSLVFMGNLSSADRKKLVADMKTDKLYTVIGLARTEQINGREVRTYKVKIDSVAYNKSLAAYLNAIGLTVAASEVQLDGADAITPIVEFSIEPNTRRLVAAGYPEVASSGAREYSNWGERYTFELPATYISSEELQIKIDELYPQAEER